jgi:hypothetical protein
MGENMKLGIRNLEFGIREDHRPNSKFRILEVPFDLNGMFHTPHVPPNPIVTLPSSTITGTARRPLLNPSMRCSSAGLLLTLMYWNSTCRRW